MKKNTKKILAFAFVSTGIVVSCGRHDVSNTQTETAKITSVDESYIETEYIGLVNTETFNVESSELYKSLEVADKAVETVLSGHVEKDVQINIEETEPAVIIQYEIHMLMFILTILVIQR